MTDIKEFLDNSEYQYIESATGKPIALQLFENPKPESVVPHVVIPGLMNLSTQNGSDGGSNEIMDSYNNYLDYETWLTDDLLSKIHGNFFMYQEKPVAVLIALYCITFFFGLLGNCVVIYVFARNRRMRTVTNSFLVNLAVCDLMVVTICMPFSTAFEIYANWIYGDVMCKMVNLCQSLAVTASILTLTVISAERFYAIRHPLQARAFMSRTRIQTIICVIWVVAAIAVLPSVLVRKEKVIEHLFTVAIKTCVEEWSSEIGKHIYNFALLLVLYVAPVVFICVGYLKIGLNLWRKDSMLHASQSASSSVNARTNLRGRRRVAKMLFVMAVLFAISWFPLHILGILYDVLMTDSLQHNGLLLRHFHSYALWLGHANSSINPICYCIMSSSFKSAIKLELKRCCFCQSSTFRRNSFMSLSMTVTRTTSESLKSRNSAKHKRGHLRRESSEVEEPTKVIYTANKRTNGRDFYVRTSPRGSTSISSIKETSGLHFL